MGGGCGPPSNTWFPGPTRVLNPNGILIGAAIFAELTTVTDRQTSTRDLDLDLGSGHTAYRRASLKYQISLKSEKKKLFVDGLSAGRDPSKFKVTWHKN